ncbi:hypothetical protein [Mycobacterium sp. 3519A]|uniref:hypothetical protein n=1 Tax=Mycobacterium sp. 3519A TaxID=2057184 RepID=UPI000C7DD9F0|nr:hypothetical protein [Mycobacterium sp. 3519A]
MNREVCKFFSGSFAALAYAHAAYAVATSTGAINEPVFLGRRWGVGYMWTEAVVYSAASLALGYVGWKAKPRQQLETSAPPATDGQRADADEELHPVSG